VRLFPSTALNHVWVVGPPGCPDDQNDSDITPNCQESRGGVFNSNRSTSYRRLFEGHGFTFGGNEAVNVTAHLGLDKVYFGYSGTGSPPQNRTLVSMYSNYTPGWIGLLGLDPRPNLFPGASPYEDPIPSMMRILKDSDMIPSLSFGYTAGSVNRKCRVPNTELRFLSRIGHPKGFFGSLMLGGYDESRRSSHGIEFEMSVDEDKPFAVGLRSIGLQAQIFSSAPSSSLNGTLRPPSDKPPIAIIDSEQPHIQLPQDQCDSLQQVLNLTWHSQSKNYLISDATHDFLGRLRPSLTFVIHGRTNASDASLSITLPWESLALNLSFPHLDVGNRSRYFPIRPAKDPRKLVLGRAFLQNAYLTADYERRKFYLHQVRWPENNETANIKSIASPAADGHGSQLSRPAIAGIVLGVVSLIVLITLGLLFHRRFRHKKAEILSQQEGAKPRSTEPHQSPAERTQTQPQDEASAILVEAGIDSGEAKEMDANNKIFELPERGSQRADNEKLLT
jgi:hypothetical protein